MTDTVESVLRRLLDELKNDWIFFGGLGLIVGFLTLLEHRLKEHGFTPHEDLASGLFTDGVPFIAFGFISMCLMALGSINTLCRVAGIASPLLMKLLSHIEGRLAQLASGIMSFTLGVAVVGLGHSLATRTLGGLQMALLICIFNALIAAGYLSTAVTARNQAPFDKWWAGVALLAMSLGVIGCLAVLGVK